MKFKKPVKFIGLFDCHVGKERMRIGGRENIRPTHSLKAIKAVVSLAKDYKPDALVLGGDQLNFGPVSHWLKGRPRLLEGFNIRQEMDLLNTLILKPFDEIIPTDGIKIWHRGNHEQWQVDFVDANPGTEGLLEPENYLKLEERGYKIYAQGETSSIGKLHFCHGDIILRNGSTVNPAKTLVNAYRKNIRCGHLHTYSAAIDTTLVDAKDFHSGIVVPSLSTRNPAFIKNNPNQFCNGCLIGVVYPNGDFWDQVLIINNGRLVYNGKMYDGNK